MVNRWLLFTVTITTRISSTSTWFRSCIDIP
jgi:hypothetical protein